MKRASHGLRHFAIPAPLHLNKSVPCSKSPLVRSERHRKTGVGDGWIVCAVTILLLVFVQRMDGVRAQSAEKKANEAKPAFAQITALIKKSDYKEADRQARAEIERLESLGEGESPQVADAIDLLVEATWRGGAKSGDAYTLADRAVKIRERVSGEESAALATTLHHYANLRKARGDLKGARALYEKSLAIRKSVFGEGARELTPSLNNLGFVESELGLWSLATEHFLLSLQLREKYLRKDDPEIAIACTSLGILFSDMGDYAESEQYHRRALEIRRKAFGEFKAPSIKARINLGNALIEQGRDAEAEELLRPLFQRRDVEITSEEAAAITAAKIGVAMILRNKGDYVSSRDLLEEVSGGLDKPPVDELTLSLTLNNLGNVLLLMGDLAGASSPLDRALEIRRRTLSAAHYDIAETLTNLGDLAYRKGDLETARFRFQEALDISIKNRGPTHKVVATALNNLALVRSGQGAYVEAIALYDKALEIQDVPLSLGQRAGDDRSLLAKTLSNKATATAFLGKDVDADALFRRAIAVREEALGASHPALAFTLSRHAALLAGSGNRQAALNAALRAERISLDHSRLMIQTLPERQSLALVSIRGSGLPTALSLCARGLEAQDTRKTWDALIRSRSLVLDSILARKGRDSTVDAKTSALEKEASKCRQDLLQHILAGPQSNDKEAYALRLDELRRRKESAEAKLAAKSPTFRNEKRRELVGLDAVERALPARAALVGYTYYQDMLRSKVGSNGDTHSYVAFVLIKGDPRPRVIDLGSGSRLDSLVASWHNEAAVSPIAANANLSAREESCRKAGDALRRAIWDPVAANLAGVTEAFIVPDGTINLVNIGALPAATGREFVIETGPLLHILTSEREIARTARSGRAKGQGLLALGAPDFGATTAASSGTRSGSDPLEVAQSGGEADGSPAEGAIAYSNAEDPERGDSDCNALPWFSMLSGTQNELERIHKVWTGAFHSGPNGRIDERTGAGATKAAFLSAAPGKQVLHLATHTFFLERRCTNASGRGYAATVLARWGEQSELKSLATGSTPLLSTGLAFTGANHARTRRVESDEGILTADELSSLNLQGVQWAVLSACETGVGGLVPGEGVLDLRRATLAAGVSTVIMSLWRIPDEPSAEWMEQLYRARFETRLPTARAMRLASLRILEDRRRTRVSTHPYFWGAFVAVGDWR
jgi:tetratricopeptide (TPR) repeat protein